MSTTSYYVVRDCVRYQMYLGEAITATGTDEIGAYVKVITNGGVTRTMLRRINDVVELFDWKIRVRNGDLYAVREAGRLHPLWVPFTGTIKLYPNGTGWF